MLALKRQQRAIFAAIVMTSFMLLTHYVQYPGRQGIYLTLLHFWRNEGHVLEQSTQNGLLKTISIPHDSARVIHFTFRVYHPMIGSNSATLLLRGCSRRRGASGVTLITGFIDLKSAAYRSSLGSLAEDTNENNLLVEARNMEVISVLQFNLYHKFVDEIHVLVRDLETAEFLHSLPLQRSDKLVIRVVNEDVGLKCQLLYAARCLPGQLVAITNQDNKIGRGWDLPWHRVINDSNTMYALTRHSEVDSNCTVANDQGTCDNGQKYLGSHDTFVLKSDREWTESTFEELEGISPDLLGMENLLIWFFQTKLNYLVLNPCKLLFVHHHHCVPARSANRQRINSKGRSGLVGFSSKLSI